MKRLLNLILSLSIIISLSTLIITGQFGRNLDSDSQILGLATTSAKIHDDGNGTLYIEYSKPQEVYDALSVWQGKYPGRTITTSSALNSVGLKYSVILFTYVGR